MDDPDGPNPARAPRHLRAPAGAKFLALGVRRGESRPRPRAQGERFARSLRHGPGARGGWSDALDFDVERAAADQSWQEVVRWAEAADAQPAGLWRRGRMDEPGPEALDRLGQDTAAEAVRRRAGAGAGRAHHYPASGTPSIWSAWTCPARSGPARWRPCATIGAWRSRSRQDYWAFLHVRGAKKRAIRTSPSAVGISEPRSGLRAKRSARRDVPDSRRHSARALSPSHGRLAPWTGKQLHPTTDRPVSRRAVVIGSLTVVAR